MTLRVLSSYKFFDFKKGPPLTETEGIRPEQALSLSVGHNGGHPFKCMRTPDSSPISTSIDHDLDRPWVCQHRWTGMPGLVRFRRQILNKGYGIPDVNKWTHDKKGHFAYSIGKEAFVALSRGYNWLQNSGNGEAFNLTGIETSIPAGEYCNLAREDSPLPEPVGWTFERARISAGCDRYARQTVLVGPDGYILNGWIAGGGGAMVALHVDYPYIE